MALPAEDLDPGLDAGTESAEPSLRDQLDAAFEEAPSDEVDPGTSEAQRARDELGRFAPEKAPASVQELRPGAPQAKGGQPGAAAPQAQPGDKAPASWTPAARERWGALDPAVKAEIQRREGEMGRVLQDGAAQRQFVDAFESIARPYEMFLRAEGTNPLQAMDGLFRMAAEMRVGTPGAKAALIADMINTHGVSIEMLDTLLANRVGIQAIRQDNQQQQAQYRDPRVDHLLALQQQQAAQAGAYEDQQIRGALDGFAQSHEFYKDVAGLMADLVEMRSNRGEPIDMERIYAQACQLHEGVSQVMSQRGGRGPGASLNASRQAVLRARRAAVSVAGESTPHGGATIPEDDSIRSILSAAMDQTTR
jgi:hypothetical protein